MMATAVTSLRKTLPVELEESDPMLICLLGGFRLLRYGQPFDSLITGKAMTLLSTLALHLNTGVPRDVLLEHLWPEHEVGQSSVSLHSLIYSLHRRLRSDQLAGPPIIYANGSYALNTMAGVSTDIARFDMLVTMGNRLAAAGQDVEAACHYERALLLYRGDLTNGSDIYAVIERERLHANFLSILAWLADRSYQDGDYMAAQRQALQLLGHDPCREDAHRLVMRSYVRRGERAQALRQYRLCEHILRREFDAAPEAATTALFDRIRSDPTSV
jgi:DNA-binding SARP family transcriptional activator